MRFDLDLYVNLRPFLHPPTASTSSSSARTPRAPTPARAASCARARPTRSPPRARSTPAWASSAASATPSTWPAAGPAGTSRWCTRPTCSPSPATSGSGRSTRWPPSTPTSTTAYNHVDAACIYFVEEPERYDVIVTDNLFGDILTDLGRRGRRRHRAGRVGQPQPGPHRARRCSSRCTARRPTSPAPARPTRPPPILSAAMMLEFLGEADAAARIRKACADAGAASRVPPPRSATPSQKGSEQHAASRRPRRSGWTASSSTGTTPRSTSSPTRCTTAAASSRASAPTRPTQGPAVFRLTDHIKRLFNSAKIFMIDIPFTGRRAGRGDQGDGAGQRARRPATSGRSSTSATARWASTRCRAR